MTVTSQANPPRRSWGRIALVAALVLSLMGNALALGAWARLRDMRTGIFGADVAQVALPADLRQDLIAALRTEASRLVPELRALAQTRRDLIAAATARPYDRVATQTTMDAFRNAVDALLLSVQPIVLDRLDEVAAEEM
jgi:hypothetical protein